MEQWIWLDVDDFLNFGEGHNARALSARFHVV